MIKCSVKRYDSEYDLMFDFELQKVVLETGDFNSSYP